jgi:molybdopterin synthase catalytic subunit
MPLGVNVSIRLFARIRELAGTDVLQLPVESATTVANIRRAIATIVPGAADLLAVSAVAVNSEYAADDRTVGADDEIAIIPPVSGGAEWPAAIRLVREPIDYASLTESVRRAHFGAVVTFLGTVRDLTGDEVTLALEYEAYAPMAEAKMAEIADDTRRRWPGCDVAMIHRLGRLDVGEISVAVAVGAAHRADAFAACRHAIDRLKELVPIWKKDIRPDGESEWIHPRPSEVAQTR